MVLLKYCSLFLSILFVIFIIFRKQICCQQISNDSLWSPVNVLSDEETSDSLSASEGVIANIQSNGLKGYVIFIRDGNITLIRAHILDIIETEIYNWKIYSVSGIFSDGSCSRLKSETPSLGLDLSTILGPLPGAQQIEFESNLDITNGDETLIGRTLFLAGIQSGKISCATILPIGPKTTFRADFHSNIQGTVFFMQHFDMTTVLSSLSYTNSFKKYSVNKWTLMMASDSDGDEYSKFYHESTQCKNLNGQQLLMNNTIITGLINIGMDPFSINGKMHTTYRNKWPIDSNLAIFMVIYSEANSTNEIACSPLQHVWPKRAVAKFNYAEVKGAIKLTQETPFDWTTVDINIETLKNAYSYGIDELPKIVRSKEESSRKCPNIKSIIYNPLNIDPNSVPVEGQGTSDQYAIGDLSGKYGTLANKTSHELRVLDSNLFLFGSHSVIGRALVFYSADGSVMACSNIELVAPNMTTAFATFDEPIQGQFIFRQPSLNCSAETYVYLEISKPGEENATQTANHSWLIHQFPINTGDTKWSTSECAGSGQRFDPFRVGRDCAYERDCGHGSPFRCQLGDTSSKLGYLHIPPYGVTDDGELDIAKYFFSDTFLPLCGPNSIVNKSVVINAANFAATPLACANIILYKPKT